MNETLNRRIKLVEDGYNLAQIAEKEGCSKQAVQQYFTTNGFNYAKVLGDRRIAKFISKRQRNCKICGKTFFVSLHLRFFCSDECAKENHDRFNRKYAKRYYHSPEGFLKMKKYRETNREHRRAYLKSYYLKKKNAN